jgi:WD40 repeat protein
MGTVLTKDSITTSIEYFNDRLLTSHEDGYIRLWDIRSPQTPTNTYKAHSKLVSSVAFNPNKSHIFSSVCYFCYFRDLSIQQSKFGILVLLSLFKILVLITIKYFLLSGSMRLSLLLEVLIIKFLIILYECSYFIVKKTCDFYMFSSM